MSDLDPRVKLSVIAAQLFDELDSRLRALVLQTLIDLADEYERGVAHAANNNEYFSSAPWSNQKMFLKRGVTVIYGLRGQTIEIDWIGFEPTLPRGGGRAAPRLTVISNYEFEILPVRYFKEKSELMPSPRKRYFWEAASRNAGRALAREFLKASIGTISMFKKTTATFSPSFRVTNAFPLGALLQLAATVDLSDGQHHRVGAALYDRAGYSGAGDDITWNSGASSHAFTISVNTWANIAWHDVLPYAVTLTNIYDRIDDAILGGVRASYSDSGNAGDTCSQAYGWGCNWPTTITIYGGGAGYSGVGEGITWSSPGLSTWSQAFRSAGVYVDTDTIYGLRAPGSVYNCLTGDGGARSYAFTISANRSADLARQERQHGLWLQACGLSGIDAGADTIYTGRVGYSGAGDHIAWGGACDGGTDVIVLGEYDYIGGHAMKFNIEDIPDQMLDIGPRSHAFTTSANSLADLARHDDCPSDVPSLASGLSSINVGADTIYRGGGGCLGGTGNDTLGVRSHAFTMSANTLAMSVAGRGGPLPTGSEELLPPAWFAGLQRAASNQHVN